jgi:hypothetical protein
MHVRSSYVRTGTCNKQEWNGIFQQQFVLLTSKKHDSIQVNQDKRSKHESLNIFRNEKVQYLATTDTMKAYTTQGMI